MENPTHAPCQVLTFSIPSSQEERDRLNAAIKEGASGGISCSDVYSNRSGQVLERATSRGEDS